MAKNVIDEYINFEKNKITFFIKEILSEYFEEDNFNKLLEVYINARYYDYYERKSETVEDNTCKYLREEALKLMADSDEEKKLKIKEILFTFNFVLYFDDVKIIKNLSSFANYICKYRKRLLKREEADFKDKILKIIQDVTYKKEKYISQFASNEFFLEYRKTNLENLTDVSINYNITFPRIYSDYAINRVFESEIIGEDRLIIEYSLISIDIINNTKHGMFGKFYLVDFSSTLFEKKDKIDRVISVIDNDCAKDKISFKITFDVYNTYKDYIKELMLRGFSFAICVNDKDINKEEDFSFLDIFRYIIINNDSKYCHIMSKNDKIVCIDAR